MKVFIALSTLLAVASAAPAQHSHQSTKMALLFTLLDILLMEVMPLPILLLPPSTMLVSMVTMLPTMLSTMHPTILLMVSTMGLPTMLPITLSTMGLPTMLPIMLLPTVSTMPPFSTMPLSTTLPLSTMLPQCTMPQLLSTMNKDQPPTTTVMLLLIATLVLTLVPLKPVMDMLPPAHTMSFFPMVVPKLLPTLLEMITPDMLPMFNTLVNLHLMLLHLPPMLNYLK